LSEEIKPKIGELFDSTANNFRIKQDIVNQKYAWKPQSLY